MPSKSETRAEAARLLSIFEKAGAQIVETDILQPAETLLDLYGEDIRARAYVTHDPSEGEQMLRPDFTVPIVQMHMSDGAAPARYAYSGEVFRRQENAMSRAREYIQVGYELFDSNDAATADAEVFSLFANELLPMGLHAATGDMGIVTAAVQGLRTSDRRKAALLRHIWRPRRFRALLDRFGGRAEVPATRKALLAATDPFAEAGPLIGLRSQSEIAARVDALRADASEPPISNGEVELIDDVLGLQEKLPNVLEHLRDIAVDMPAISAAVERIEKRADALQARGINVDNLDFEASYGRTQMEYYDGFVFGFYAAGRPDLPPVATGGRYDALTRVLGQGRAIPAVGGVIRPALLLELEADK